MKIFKKPLSIVVAATFPPGMICQLLSEKLAAEGLPATIENCWSVDVVHQLSDAKNRMFQNAGGINILLVRLDDWANGSVDGADALTELFVRRRGEDLVSKLRFLAQCVDAWCIVCLILRRSLQAIDKSDPNESARYLEDLLESEVGWMKSVRLLKVIDTRPKRDSTKATKGALQVFGPDGFVRIVTDLMTPIREIAGSHI
jgi:hypothetical protein